ncbi:MAG: hypothetical protein WC379_08585 [Methanoregula sp.]|jgi:hypothetical protein
MDPLPEKKIMSEQLFDTKLSDPQEISFPGVISLFEGNEPLLDKRIYHCIGLIPARLPHAKGSF